MPLPGIGRRSMVGRILSPHSPSEMLRAIFSFALLASWTLPALLLLLSWPRGTEAMRTDHVAKLRRETFEMFYHGFDNYMNIAFPEDELRPVSCTPLSRDALTPSNVALNDVLGNYSLTLIDSLSTLAILASSPPEDGNNGPKALSDFQNGVAALVEQYGDGRPGPSGQGLRARGFDLDSKVQVFETVIRGLGGLLSAHLFAVGELPIAGYRPPRSDDPLKPQSIPWPNGMKYDGQLLRLALDLGQRLLPAFYTETGMPYPRVNLRHGIPFYTNSPIHDARAQGATKDGPHEITETCSAGAGSLVLEFTVLSRLTGDARFEQLAKRAFWAVWARRSDIGLIGAGLDAEGGQWVGAFSVIGAGADSFFEYALKAHILLSGHELPNRTLASPKPSGPWLDPNTLYEPLSDEQNSPDSFLQAWHHAHAAIKRHLYNEGGHPHYVNVNLWTGSLATQWIDSLGAYYSGLLTLAGELEEAIETNLLYAAIWTKYSALPERWSLQNNRVEGGLGWWPLRPEFIESTYHLFRATRDPWYLYVGEMVLRDITRRCWAECGWTGLENVVNGEQSDRMESFFLGETAKYMYLLFDSRHPLNSFDAPYVFTTEGHPLIIPRKARAEKKPRRKSTSKEVRVYYDESFTNSCPAPPKSVPLTGSAVAGRKDIFHASRLLDLHSVPNLHAGIEAGSESMRLKPIGNHTHFPWTLPPSLLPDNGTCAKVYQPLDQYLEFTAASQQAPSGSAFNFLAGPQGLGRIGTDIVRISTISGLKLVLRMEDEGVEREWRVVKVNGLPLGRDENVVINRAILGDISDRRFNLVRDPVLVKLHHLHGVDLTPNDSNSGRFTQAASQDARRPESTHVVVQSAAPSQSAFAEDDASVPTNIGGLVKMWFRQLASSLDRPSLIPGFGKSPYGPINFVINATGVTPTGIGAAPLPDVDMPAGSHIPNFGPIPKRLLPWESVFPAGHACKGRLPDEAARDHDVIVIRRGGCSFSEKLANIPSYTPSSSLLQLVVVVSDDEKGEGGEGVGAGAGAGASLLRGDGLIRPLLDEVQRTPAGIARRHPVPMIMVGGGDAAYHQLAHADRVGMTRRYYIESQGARVRNLIVDDGDAEMPAGGGLRT